MRLSGLALLLTLLAAASPAAAQTSPQREPVTKDLPVTTDTWVDEASSESAHADDESLVARLADGKGSRILIAFDLSELEGADITAARLTLNSSGGGGQPSVQIAVSGIKAPWGAKTTWLTQPERTSTYSIVDVPTTAGPVSWDVTSLLRENIGLPGGLHGLALNGPVVASAAAFDRAFTSSEGSKDAVKLSVTYTPALDAGTEGREPAGSSLVRIVITIAVGLAMLLVVFTWIRRRSRGESDG